MTTTGAIAGGDERPPRPGPAVAGSATDPAEGPSADLGLVARGVTKSFGALTANDGIDLALQVGRVHAVLGENGAGKSTLVSILDGRQVPDEGDVSLNGRPLVPGDPGRAAEQGVATVHQDLALVPSMTGMENISLAVPRHAAARVAEVEQRFSLTETLDVPVSELQLPQRQRIELIRALCQQPTVLILDEPTTFLPPTEIESFLLRVRELADEGLAVMLITHRLDEARLIADDVTVIRRGRVVGTFDRASFPSNEELAVAMVGATVVEPTTSLEFTGDTIIEVKDLRVEDGGHAALDGVSLQLRAGEILGVAGVDGNGQLELLEGIGGLRGLTSGELIYDGEDVAAVSYSRRSKLGIQFVSGERKRDGIIPTFTIAEHFSYVLGQQSTDGLDEILVEYAVNPPRAAARAEHLSGGNQQKMILARALQLQSKVLLLSYPTQGLDVLATAQLHRLLVERAKSGLAIVIASSDLDELLTISHRVVVMNRGRIIGEQACTSFDRQELAAWFTGTLT
jgi:ABC-type uncharacterized transport system ATPase subunit